MPPWSRKRPRRPKTFTAAPMSYPTWRGYLSWAADLAGLFRSDVVSDTAGMRPDSLRLTRARTCYIAPPAQLYMHLINQRGKWIHVGLERNQQSNQARQCDRMEEHVAQDVALMPIPFGRGGGDHD